MAWTVEYDDGQVFDLIRQNLGTANLFTFGIGSSVNRHLIEGMAHAGQGEAFVLTQVVGLSYEEAADVVGCPIGTIRSRVARGRDAMAAALRAGRNVADG